MNELSELFVLYKQYSDSGKIWLMLGLDTTGSDYNDILTIAECLAKDGHEVKVLHAVHYKDPLYRVVFGDLIGTRYYRKCPDLIVDGEYVEYESYRTDQPKKAFRNMFHNGLSQSERIIIRKCNVTDGYILHQVQGYIQNNIPVSEVWIFNGEEVKLLYKNTEG